MTLPIPGGFGDRAFGAWLPIESAPRDGSWILVFAPDAKIPGVAYFCGDTPTDGDGGWFPHAKHWMPLPEPPSSEAAVLITPRRINNE